jgi:hypothetical protein
MTSVAIATFAAELAITIMNAFSFLLKGPFKAKVFTAWKKSRSKKYVLDSDSETIQSGVRQLPLLFR